MTEVSVNTKERTADFAVEAGCQSCGGALDVRVSPGGNAWSYCRACHRIAKPQVVLEGNQLQLAQGPAARA